MSGDPNVTEPTGVTQDPPATPPAGNAQTGTTVTEAQYKGLQATYQKLHDDFTALQKKHQDLVTEHEDLKLAQNRSSKDGQTLKDQIAAKDIEIEQLKNEVKSKDGDLTRTKLIMTEFPDLAEFEGQSLLPYASDEEGLRTKLTSFKEAVGKTVKAEVDKKIKGAGAPSVGGQPPPKLDKDQLYNQMISVAGVPGQEEKYGALYEQWLALQDQ